MEVESFLSLIFSYFSFFVLAGRPYQGRLPLQKYIRTKPRDSKSSLRDYSIMTVNIMIDWLTYSEMRVYWGIPGRTREVLAVTVGDVLACLGVSEALSEAEIDNINVVLFFSDTNEEVIGLDISVKEVARVHKLDSLELKFNVLWFKCDLGKIRNIVDKGTLSTYHLVSEHEDSLERELALAVIKEILKTRA